MNFSNSDATVPSVRFEDVVKRYGSKPAIDGVSFTIGKGEIVGLLGRNGAGKSTVMNVMTGYLPTDCGKVCICGVDMAKHPEQAKRHIGYLPESPPLYDSMTVMEYLRFAAKIKRVPRAGIGTEVSRICDEVGLDEVRHRLARNLSKGYRQRLGVAQAMLGNPDILILDEPTAGLDPKQIVEIRSLIRDFGIDCTVLISSHILPEISEICERVLILRAGKLVGDGRLNETGSYSGEFAKLRIRVTGGEDVCLRILRGVKGLSSFRFLGTAEPCTADWHVEYRLRETGVRESLFEEIANAGEKLLMSKPIETSIEDMFLQMTADGVEK
ncbi:MAG: ABC transporter ATP-binding protein [Synergistaceae bacterium]|nr:ABC transporter ATP-binding protein [Synergistaceae bacterium]